MPSTPYTWALNPVIDRVGGCTPLVFVDYVGVFDASFEFDDLRVCAGVSHCHVPWLWVCIVPRCVASGESDSHPPNGLGVRSVLALVPTPDVPHHELAFVIPVGVHDVPVTVGFDDDVCLVVCVTAILSDTPPDEVL